jgi:alpha-tubulin suppressor-like RCC1 family protein
MYGWGRNLHGQLGLSNLSCPPVPTPADVPFSVMAVAAGAEFSLMVDHTGAVWSSGNNDCGQLGFKLPPSSETRYKITVLVFSMNSNASMH